MAASPSTIAQMASVRLTMCVPTMSKSSVDAGKKWRKPL
jgi:hypothetical protein